MHACSQSVMVVHNRAGFVFIACVHIWVIIHHKTTRTHTNGIYAYVCAPMYWCVCLWCISGSCICKPVFLCCSLSALSVAFAGSQSIHMCLRCTSLSVSSSISIAVRSHMYFVCILGRRLVVWCVLKSRFLMYTKYNWSPCGLSVCVCVCAWGT